MPVEQEPKCITKWEAFDEANLAPTSILCQDYFPAQRADTSCHSKLLLKVESILGHMAPDHAAGGGFQFTLKRSEKKHPIWMHLKNAGVEIHDFRCDVCDRELPLVPRRIIKHLEAHSGKTHAPRPGGVFNITLRFDPPFEDAGDLY